MKLATIILLSCLSVRAGQINEQKLATAIRHAEGKWNYGIKHVANEQQARQKCLKIIHPIITGWEQHGCRGDLFVLLGSWYCPPNAAQVNKNWVKNVRWHYNHL